MDEVGEPCRRGMNAHFDPSFRLLTANKLVMMCGVALAACATATHSVCFATTRRQTRLFTKAALSKKNCRDHVSGAGTAPAPIPHVLWNNT